jgi:hypothetical protein
MVSALLQKLCSVPLAVAALLVGVVVGSTSVCAAVEVQGDATSIQIVAHDAPISVVLSALSQTLSVRIHATTSLDSVINGTFRGPLKDVLARLLSGYNYVITTGESSIEVKVVGKVGNAPVVARAQTALPANTNPAAQWRSPFPAKKP